MDSKQRSECCVTLTGGVVLIRCPSSRLWKQDGWGLLDSQQLGFPTCEVVLVCALESVYCDLNAAVLSPTL